MLKKLNLTRAVGMLAASAAALGLATFATTEAKAADFSGKRVTILVPFAESGGTDIWTRMMQPHLEKYLPGNPRVLVVNRPGAGGITGANYYHERAEKDGTWIFALSISTALNYALRDPRFKFTMVDYHPVLSSPRSSVQYFHRDLGIQEIGDLKGRIEKLKSFPVERLTFGGRTPTSVDLTYRLALSLLGIEANNVWGLGGTGPMALGFERGEFVLSAENSLAFQNQRKHLIDAGIAHTLYTNGNIDADGNYGRDPALPDVPSFVEAYKAYHGKEPSGPGFEAWQALMQIGVAMNKTLLLHQDVPESAVEAWRTAVRTMLKDEEFLTKAEAELGPYPQIVGEPIREIMQNAFDIKPEVRDWLNDYVKTRFGIELAG